MRNTRFAESAVAAYREAPEVQAAEVYSEGTTRPLGIRIRLADGREVRHAITMVTPEGEDLNEPEQRVEGEPPALIEQQPHAGESEDQKTARLLAAILARTQHPEMKEVYVYAPESQHPGLGVVWHSGRRTHMLLNPERATTAAR